MMRIRGLICVLFFSCFSAMCALAVQENAKPSTDTPQSPSETRGDKPSEANKQVQSATQDRLETLEKLLRQLSSDISELKSSQRSSQQTTKTPTAPVNQSSSTPSPRSGTATVQDPRATRNQAPPASVKLESAWLDEIKWRSIGPANMSGRITDVAVYEKDASLWWIATASGGLLKTTNHGVTMQHSFDREKVVSIGSIATDPTNPDVLWVGTGEINPRNSVSYGNGVYKTIDGGKTFQHLGLDRTYQIARILVDPKNPNTVYVGAAGRLYGKNSERGVYKTTDGGKTWQQVFFVDDQTGVIDMVMNPQDPNMIVAAFWDRMRDGFDSWPGSEPKPDGVDGYDPIRKWGPGGGLYRTTDGGKTWNKISQGLPKMTGRIGLDWQLNSPNSLFAIIDCEEIGKGPKPFPAFLGIVGDNVDGKPTVTQLLPDCPANKAGVKIGDQIVAIDDEKCSQFDQLLDVLRAKKVGSRIGLKVRRGEQEKSFDILLAGRPGTNQQNVTIYLGVTGEDKENKITLQRVVDGGPASKAGLKAGDVIAKVAGQTPKNFRAMMDELQKKSEGDKVELEVVRKDETIKVEVTLDVRVGGGTQQTPAQSNVFMGIQGENAKDGGASLTSITEGGPGEKAGLKAGDIVTQLDGKEVADYAGLTAEIRTHKPEDKLKLKVRRGDNTLDVEVVLADRLSGGSGTRPYTYSYFGQQPNIQDQQGSGGYKYGGIYKSTDSGQTWQRVNSLNTRPMYFSVIKVDPKDDQKLYVLGVAQHQSMNGGVTFTDDFGQRVHADGHDLWINPSDGRNMIIGCDGGVYVTYDRGATWDHINTTAIGQFYHVSISQAQPYWVAGGLQDNGSWAGPAISRAGGAVNEDWINLNGGDGFVCRIDPNDADLFYAESQNGAIVRRHMKTGDRGSVRPARVEGTTYRFNWNTPFILSSHNSKIFYSAGNYVFRSLDRGNDLKPISPEITLTKRGSGTALSESPRDSNVLYAGTDDGALWVTRDGGANWKNITANLGLPSPRWVATIEASRHAPGRVFVCLDGHRSDDDNPYLFVSEDFGDSFKPLHQSLPWGSTRCLREDSINPNLLFTGTEFAFWISIDRGQNWTQFNQNLPTVAVHDVAIHPNNGEIVVATHGRSLWACDVSGLRQITADHVAKEIAFFEPLPVTRWRSDPSRGTTNRRFISQNPSNGAKLWYSLPQKSGRVVARIENIEGELISEVAGKSEPGLHMIQWDLTQSNRRGGRDFGGQGGPGFGVGSGQVGTRGGRGRPTSDQAQRTRTESGEITNEPSTTSPINPPTEPTGQSSGQTTGQAGSQATQEDSDAEGQQRAEPNPAGRPPQGFQGFRGGRPVANGTYRVQLLIDGKVIKTFPIVIYRDPNLPDSAVADELYELGILMDKQAKEDKYQNKRNGRGVFGDD